MTRRRWIADEWNDTSAVLRETQAAHLARVLRAQVGQEFDIVAGGRVRRGVVQSIHENAVEFSLHEEVTAATPLPFIVGMSIIRFERLEWAIEKLTELGVERVVPIAAQRSEKHLTQAAAKRVERWRKIARESAQQSRRVNAPEIGEPIRLMQWLEEKQDGVRLLLSEHEHDRGLRESVGTGLPSKTIYAAIGPEGGWTEVELASFEKHGWQPVSLGPRILRAETAAIAVASVIGVFSVYNG